MMTLYMVTTSYQTCYPDPLILNKGDSVQYGEEDTDYPKWIFCETDKSHKKGWVPKQFLTVPNEKGEAYLLETYTAHELTVAAGERLIVKKELNGWLFARTEKGEEGWIPADHAVKATTSKIERANR